jgi:hypothetical protein
MSLGWAWLLMLCFCALSSPALACDEGIRPDHALAAVEEWKSAKRIGLTDGAQSKLTNRICGAIALVAEQSGATPLEIDASSREAVLSYLDATASGQRDVPGLPWLLGQNFVFNSGPEPPEPYRLVLLRITYHHNVDSLLIDGSPKPVLSEMLATTGTISISGMRAGQIVCHAAVSILAPGPQSYIC